LPIRVPFRSTKALIIEGFAENCSVERRFLIGFQRNPAIEAGGVEGEYVVKVAVEIVCLAENFAVDRHAVGNRDRLSRPVGNAPPRAPWRRLA
jgi:hypothetical protein